MTQKERSSLVKKALFLIGEKGDTGKFPPGDLLDMSLDNFKTDNLAVRIRSKVLGEDAWLCSNETVRDHLQAEGLVCYLADEISHLKGLSPEATRQIHEVKRVFEKSRLIE